MKKKLILVVAIVILIAALIVGGFGAKSAMKGGRLHRFLVAHSIRHEGVYRGKKILVFNGHSFVTEDGMHYDVTMDGTVLKNIWVQVTINGQPGHLITVDSNELETPTQTGTNNNPHPAPTYEEVKP